MPSSQTLPSGASVSVTNITQLNGTTIDTNSGNKSAGTERIVIATDQPQLTNALKADLAGTTVPLPTGASTSALQTTGNTSLSNIDTKTPALVGGRQPVDGSGVTQPISNANLDAPLSGLATQATLALIKAKTDNIDVALSSRTKPADQQHVIIDSGTITTLPAGLATSANQASQITGVGITNSLLSDPFNGAFIQQDINGSIARETGGNLQDIKIIVTNLLSTVAKESDGNLETIAENMLSILDVLKSQQDLLFTLVANQDNLQS